MKQIAVEKNLHGEEKNSLVRNIVSVFGVLFRRFPQSRWQVPLFMACNIAMPFMATLIPSLALRGITSGDMRYFLVSLTVALCVYWGMQVVNGMVSLYLEHDWIYTGLGGFFTAFMRKVLNTDYVNIEPQAMQKKIKMASLASTGSGQGAQLVMSETVEFLSGALGLLIYGSAVLALDVRILLVTVVLFGVDVLLRSYALRYSDKHWEENSEIYRKMSYLERSGSNIPDGKDIRIYQMKAWFHHRFEELIRQGADYERRKGLRWYFPTIADDICSFVRNILAYGILVSRVLAGEIDVAGFTLYLGLIAGLDGWIYPLSLSFYRLQEGSHRFNDYVDFMHTPDVFVHREKTEEKEEGQHCGQPMEVIFKDVSFAYGEGGPAVLSHLNFTIKAGEKVALVGSSGAGKTTLVKLLCGLYPAAEGEILINGKKLRETDVDDYQDLIGVLFQDTAPLAFSIAMNVSGCSQERTDRERVRESLRQAGLWEKVESLPDREDTYLTQMLDDGGILLSGGEMQKLLLARAIYKGGTMLVLDEPTAALDPLAESKVYEDYHALAGGKTSLFISHRLASTKFCDRILFMENGRITESGTHQELMALGGRYKEMFEIQSHYYKDKEEVRESER